MASLELDSIQVIRDNLADRQALFIDVKKPEESKARYEQLLAQMDSVLKEFTGLPCQKLTLLLDARTAIPATRIAKLPDDAQFVGIVGAHIGAVFDSKKNNQRTVLKLQ